MKHKSYHHLPGAAHHDLEPGQVGAVVAEHGELDGVVHPVDLQHLQVGAGVGLEETNEIRSVVLVSKVEVKL